MRLAFLVIVLLPAVAAAEDLTAQHEGWDRMHREALAAYADGRLEEALASAERAQAHAATLFSADDPRASDSELLALRVRSTQHWSRGEEPPADLIERMALLYERASVRGRMHFPMRWQEAARPLGWPEARHFILRFEDFPQHAIGLYSPDLGRYLDTLPDDRLPAVFEVSYEPTGQLLSYHLAQVGQLTDWTNRFGYDLLPDAAEAEPSPWGEPVDLPGS